MLQGYRLDQVCCCPYSWQPEESPRYDNPVTTAYFDFARQYPNEVLIDITYVARQGGDT